MPATETITAELRYYQDTPETFFKKMNFESFSKKGGQKHKCAYDSAVLIPGRLDTKGVATILYYERSYLGRMVVLFVRWSLDKTNACMFNISDIDEVFKHKELQDFAKGIGLQPDHLAEYICDKAPD